jgi:plasmid maintenance system killer protein
LTLWVLVDILFRSRKLERLCNDDRLAQREWGKPQATQLARRLDDLKAARCLEDLRHAPGGLHELKGDRAGQLSMSLKGGDRLVFEPSQEPRPLKADGGLDWNQVTAIRVVEVGNYHD